MGKETKTPKSQDTPAFVNRAQPHSEEVERAVLSGMMRDDRGVDIVVEHFQNPEMFYSHIHRTIFEAILELSRQTPGKKIDAVSLGHLLATQGKLDLIGGIDFLAELYSAVPTTVQLDNWCMILGKYAILRRMIDVCSESMLKCYDQDADVSQLIDQIETDIFNIRSNETTTGIVQVKEILEQVFRALCELHEGKTEVGIPTGYAQIDYFTGGLKPGEMFVLAARPSIGKTTLALNIIRNLVLPTRTPVPRSVAFFSLEMTKEQIARRLLCTEAGLSETVFWRKSSLDTTKLTGAVNSFKEARLFIDETSGITVAELRAKARRMKMQGELDVVVIDYLQLMHGDIRQRADSRQQEVAEISGGIKALAKDLKIPVLVLAQLNREVDKANAGARPKLAHLRESGTIEQDADIVTFLHRNRDQAKGISDPNQSVPAEWIVEKNRNGQTGEIKLNFFPAKMEFMPASPYDDKDCPH